MPPSPRRMPRTSRASRTRPEGHHQPDAHSDRREPTGIRWHLVEVEVNYSSAPSRSSRSANDITLTRTCRCASCPRRRGRSEASGVVGRRCVEFSMTHRDEAPAVRHRTRRTLRLTSDEGDGSCVCERSTGQRSPWSRARRAARGASDPARPLSGRWGVLLSGGGLPEGAWYAWARHPLRDGQSEAHRHPKRLRKRHKPRMTRAAGPDHVHRHLGHRPAPGNTVAVTVTTVWLSTASSATGR
jgi:hypothetical protein